MQTQTVRISAQDHFTLSELSKDLRKPMAEILSEALHEFQRTLLLLKTNEAYQRLKQNSDAWAEEESERRLWDNTLADGEEDDHS